MPGRLAGCRPASEQELQQGPCGGGPDARLVAEQQDDGVRVRVERGDAGGDRGGTAPAEVRVEHDLAAGGVDRALHLPGGTAQGQHGLVEAAVPGGRQHGVEEDAVAVGEQLLGPAQAPRRPGRQDQPRRPVRGGGVQRVRA